MSVRSWRTSLEETIVSEYVDNIIKRKKKKKKSQSPYCASTSKIASRPPSSTKACITKSSSLTNVSHNRASPYRARSASVRNRSGSLGSVTSLNSSQLSIYSAQLESSNPRLYERKQAKRVKLFTTKEKGKFVVISCFNELCEKANHQKIYTSDGTLITDTIFNILPHNCHVFISDPTKTDTFKPKIVWTKDGIVVSGVQPKKGTRTNLNERMQRLVGVKKSRIQVYRNSEIDKGVQIVEGSIESMMSECSALLGMSVNALYTTEGDLIDSDTELLSVLRHSHLKGPLWATKGGESFSYSGSQSWLHLQQKQLRKDINEEQDKITQGYLDDISDDRLSSLQCNLDKMKDSLRGIGQILSVISDKAFDEEYEGSKFKLRNIPLLSDNSRLIGRLNTKVNVLLNGRNVEPRVVIIPGGTFHPTLDWMLEQCQLSHHKALGSSTQKATILYKNDGTVVKHISELDSDMDLFLSFGEPFKPAVTRTYLDLAFCGVTIYDFPDGPNLAIKRVLEDEELAVLPRDFRVVEGVPENYKLNEMLMKQKSKQLKFTLKELLPKQVFSTSTYLQKKSHRQSLVRPELAFNEYKSCKSSGLSASSQTWIYTRNFQLKCKSFPKLYLTVTANSLLIQYKGQLIEGYTVNLTGNSDSTWQATDKGKFVCERTGLYLTLIDDEMTPKVTDSSVNTQNSFSQYIDRSENTDVYSSSSVITVPRSAQGEVVVLGALPHLDKSSNQGWAFKQEGISLLGQWKLCDIDNPEWARECLSWPTNTDGSTNEDIAWPMEGLLFPKPPPMSSPIKRSSSSIIPLRLCVKPNGSCGEGKLITAPDLSNMRKDMDIKRKLKQINYQPDTKKWLNVHQKDIEIEEKEEILDLEIRLFLDRCKTVLDLPKPLTRLYNEVGEELVSLESLSRDAVVYVSSGNNFIIPDVDKAARNKLIQDISSDIDIMKTYCSIIAPCKYALGVELVQQNIAVELQICNDDVGEMSFDINEILDIAEKNKTFHEDGDEDEERFSIVSEYDNAYHCKSHEYSNNIDNQLVMDFPWRNPAFIAGIVKNKNDWETTTTESINSDSLQSASVASLHRQKLCNQWIYKNGNFFILDAPSLVLGILDDNSVGLVTYKPLQQQWNFVDTIIQHYNGEVLTVQTVSVMPPHSVDYSGAKLKLVPLVDTENGNNNQKWSYNAKTGHLTPFAGSPLCQGISAALQTKLCTYTVTGTLNAQQPTYIMENPGLKGIPSENSYIYVCGSCVTSLRDRYTIEKCNVTSYVCSIGYFSAHKGLKIRSSLRALNGLDGLSIDEAYGTLYLWECLLKDIRTYSSIEDIEDSVKHTLLLECPNQGLVLVRCYTNGQGPPKKGVLFLSSSFNEILNKSAVELKVGRPVTRLFFVDGTEIFSFDDLLADNETTVPYREIVISTGEPFIKTLKSINSHPSIDKQIKKINTVRRSSSLPIHSHSPCKQALPVYVVRNGSNQAAVRVVANSINGLLEIATSRLNMPSSARRIFTCQGKEVAMWSDITRDQALILSMGEGYIGKNSIKENSRRKQKWLQRRLQEKN